MSVFCAAFSRVVVVSFRRTNARRLVARSGRSRSAVYRETPLAAHTRGRIGEIRGEGQRKSSARGRVVQRGRQDHQLAGFRYLDQPGRSAFAQRRRGVSRRRREVYRQSDQSARTSPVCCRPYRRTYVCLSQCLFACVSTHCTVKPSL